MPRGTADGPPTQSYLCETAAGWMIIEAGAEGVVGLGWPRELSPQEARALRRTTKSWASVEPPWLGSLKRDLQAYWTGEPVQFDVPLDLSRASRFQRRVLEECAKVAYGETLTYGELARRAGRPSAARAVGRVMASNPIGIIVP